MPRAIAVSSSSAAVMVGVSAPSGVRWNSEREVEKPSAPACKPLLDQRRHGRHVLRPSPARDRRRAGPSRRRAAAHAAPGWRSRCRSAARPARRDIRESSASSTARLRCMTISGMSSTPSITLISVSRSCGRQGAKPTPQLPISTVVTPWPDDGAEALVPGRLAVIVRVDVDEARRDDEALGVDLLAARAGDAADRGDAAVLDRRRRPRAARRRCRRAPCRLRTTRSNWRPWLSPVTDGSPS